MNIQCHFLTVCKEKGKEGVGGRREMRMAIKEGRKGGARRRESRGEEGREEEKEIEGEL